ncbi:MULTISPECIES: MnhB domain-containing protein [Sorangium]|uniref:Cation:proton antiporter n=1 Tax=Sorangium cellulosum TaxID=56 RepID=A0A4P2QGQ0_SORCE|nr:MULTISPECIES: MnhB domain-containing protein [Sorangium]AUX29054.1 cation:proton antiporter [Sorangium cellulosum]WCQ88444.1 Na(+)/H(+) antiporter subunit B [Sorangium sp. Soce836]
MRSPFLSYVATGVLPLIVVFALFLLLRGHDAPGGGFIAGLVTTIAFVLAALAFGAGTVRAALPPLACRMPWIGLLVAAASGLPAVARGQGFLTHYHVQIGAAEAPALRLSTTLLFDVGVYLTVVGAAIKALDAFAAEAPP